MTASDVSAKIERTGRCSWYITVSWPIDGYWLRFSKDAIAAPATRRTAERKARRMIRRQTRLLGYKAEATTLRGTP